MKNRQKTENQLLERLNKRTEVKPFIQEVIHLITGAIDQLMLKVFRKDDYAVKYAVEPLLQGDGPLGELAVRLKLVYALGAISREIYEDIELFLALNETLQQEQQRYEFTDDEIIGPVRMLHCMGVLPEMMRFDQPEDVIDQQLIDLQKYRYKQMVRSSLVLAVTVLVTEILDMGKIGIGI